MSDKKFGVVKAHPLQDPELSLRAKGFYALLCTFADKNRVCYPSVSLLCDYTGTSRRTIERIIAELVEHEYIVRKGRRFYITDHHSKTQNTRGSKPPPNK